MFICTCAHTYTPTHTFTPIYMCSHTHILTYTCPNATTHSDTLTCFLTHKHAYTLDKLGRIFPLPSRPIPTQGIHLSFQWQPQSSKPSGNTGPAELCQAGGEDSQGQRRGGQKAGRLPDSSPNDTLAPPQICPAPTRPLTAPASTWAAPATPTVFPWSASPTLPPQATPAPTLVTSKNSHTVSF